MKNNTVETFEHAGLACNIYNDEMYQDSPDDWGDTDLFLVAFHRDFTVDREGFSREVCQLLNEKGDIFEESLRERVAQIKREYHFFGLEAYIHSGVRLALSHEGNFPDRQWDVSQLGLVFVSKKETRSKEKARKLALGLIETWNQNLSGDVYGYVIGEDGDSCWGFYGIDAVREAAKEAAEAQRDDTLKKHTAKKRSEIKNRIPLEKRTQLAAILI